MDNLFLILLGAMPLGMGIISGLPLPLKTCILFVRDVFESGKLVETFMDGTEMECGCE